jgi:hypothetical protein
MPDERAAEGHCSRSRQQTCSSNSRRVHAPPRRRTAAEGSPRRACGADGQGRWTTYPHRARRHDRWMRPRTAPRHRARHPLRQSDAFRFPPRWRYGPGMRASTLSLLSGAWVFGCASDPGPAAPADPNAVRSIAEIPGEELRAAHRACVTRDPVTEIARFFGVRQLSAGARERIQHAIEAPRS